MNETPPEATQKAATAAAAANPSFSHWRDAAIIIVVAAVAWALCARYNISEALHRLTAPYESLQLDELPSVFLVAAIGMAWFAWRRYREARRELHQRQRVQRHLATTLEENRRLARRIIDAQEVERRTLARELHDEMGQYLNAIKLDAVAVGKRTRDDALRTRAHGIVDGVDHVHRVVQTLIRRLRPVALDELGLQAALEHSVSHWRRRMPDTALQLISEGDIEHCGEAANLAIYRIVQESLTNIARHARAKQVSVRLDPHARSGGGAGAIHLSIEDDGVGADLDALSLGIGLIGMRERVEMLGGEFHAGSKPGQGFVLNVVVPVTAPGAAPCPN